MINECPENNEKEMPHSGLEKCDDKLGIEFGVLWCSVLLLKLSFLYYICLFSYGA